MTMTRRLGMLAAAFALAACGSSDGGGGTGSGSAGAPKILSLHSQRHSLTPADTLVIDAVVTDPDGLDDVIGGDLLTPDGVAYGAFSTDAREGAYRIAVPWRTLDAVIPVQAAEARTLRAEFYDLESHTVWRDVVVQL